MEASFGATDLPSGSKFYDLLASEASKQIDTLFTPAEVLANALKLNRASSPAVFASSKLRSSSQAARLTRSQPKDGEPVRLPAPMTAQRDGKVVAATHGFLADSDLTALMRVTGYTRRQIYELFARFKSLVAQSSSVDGVDRTTFRRGNLGMSLEDPEFVDRVFDLLDADGSGSIVFAEFLTAAYLLEKGSREARAEFLFKASAPVGSRYYRYDC